MSRWAAPPILTKYARKRQFTQAVLTAEYGTQVANPVAERGFEDWRTGMLETIAIILIVLWLLGVVSGYTLGNFIYVLLVIAIVLFLVRLVSGRRVV
jgi:hypothetical protein